MRRVLGSFVVQGQLRTPAYLEIIHDSLVRPTSHRLDAARQIPVVYRHQRLNPLVQKSIDEFVVVSQPVLVHPRIEPRRQNPSPRDGKAIEIHAEVSDKSDVLFCPVVCVTCYVSVAAVRDEVGLVVGEVIPDAFALSALVPSTFDLVGRRRHSEKESIGERFGVQIYGTATGFGVVNI